MADHNQVERVKQGVAAWNTWREQHLDVKPDLSGADLSNANLSGANLSEANLSEANLSNASLRETILADLDLRSAQGLIEIRHRGPSFVSLHSIQLPHDGSALHFLRGVGIPDDWIDFYHDATYSIPVSVHQLLQ